MECIEIKITNRLGTFYTVVSSPRSRDRVDFSYMGRYEYLTCKFANGRVCTLFPNVLSDSKFELIQ